MKTAFLLSRNTPDEVLHTRRTFLFHLYGIISEYIRSAHEFKKALKLADKLELDSRDESLRNTDRIWHNTDKILCDIYKTLQFYMGYHTSDLLFKVYPVKWMSNLQMHNCYR